MGDAVRCPSAEHDLYSCPRWLTMLAAGGRGASGIVSCGPNRLPLHDVAPTRNQRYTAEHLLRGLDRHPSATPMIGGPASGYRTDYERDPGSQTAVFDQLRSTAREAGRPIVVPFLPRGARPTPLQGAMLLHEEVECWIRPATDLETFASRLSKSRRWNLRRNIPRSSTLGYISRYCRSHPTSARDSPIWPQPTPSATAAPTTGPN